MSDSITKLSTRGRGHLRQKVSQTQRHITLISCHKSHTVATVALLSIDRAGIQPIARAIQASAHGLWRATKQPWSAVRWSPSP